MSTPLIEIKDVTKDYLLGPVTVNALRGVSFKVSQGDMFAIVGPSGCGKSTLMNILGLLDRPTQGVYSIEGNPVAVKNDEELSFLRNQKIGFVFQQYNLLSKLSVADNVSIPLLYRGWSQDKIDARVQEVLAAVKMDDRSHHKPTELSGGQQQRVAIARALCGDPSIILADEPTGALDTVTSSEIINLFHGLNQDKGITIILITHAPEIADQCKSIVRLKDGLVV